MLGFLEPLKKFCRGEKVAIDNPVFRLHYKVTVILFILGSVLLNGKQYFGEPIECTTRSEVPAKIVSTYCWITGTYTIPGDPTMFRSACIDYETMRVGSVGMEMTHDVICDHVTQGLLITNSSDYQTIEKSGYLSQSGRKSSPDTKHDSRQG